jgi:glycine hydroxymethyltransferase
MPQVAEWIDRVVTGDEEVVAKVRAEVAELMQAYPAPGLSVLRS